MKKLVLALTAASALAAAAAPAAAQPYGGGYERHQRYDNDRADRLMWRIERAERRVVDAPTRREVSVEQLGEHAANDLEAGHGRISKKMPIGIAARPAKGRERGGDPVEPPVTRLGLIP